MADDIGTPNEFNGEEGGGPLFAWNLDAIDTFIWFQGTVYPMSIPTSGIDILSFSWGVGSVVNAPEPGSLSMLLAGCVLLLTVGNAIFDGVRRRRQA